jgi:starch phosphorylase
MGLPMVAMGILYGKGYFSQHIDSHGIQVVKYKESNFKNLPIKPVTGSDHEPLKFALRIKGRNIWLQLWVARVGHVPIYLMDSDLEINSEQDRKITHQLYGGDSTNRLLQELILGMGSVRAHRLLGLHPTVWHINEGHAAFQIIELCRELVEQGLDFETALESVAATTVFTTHTPVAAGHDIFDRTLMDEYFHDVTLELGISKERFWALGETPGNPNGFNMTALALRGSRFHNGVSKIHGTVASRMEGYVWKEIPAEDNPMTFVTNGIHVPTFLAGEWCNLFDTILGGGWRSQLLNAEYWSKIRAIPNHRFWSIRETLKATMLENVHKRYTHRLRRNGVSESQIRRMTRLIDPQKTDVLTVGFARRFATYKRATLLFANIDHFAKIIGDAKKPVVFIFAGKAHPHDKPGQELIRSIHDLSFDPRFEGHIVLLEDYDIALARELVTGVDVWLNTPVYPLEASGTSGQKAGINGVLNLSVLDGWWGEGYNGSNGWAITAHDEMFSPDFRDAEENRELLDIIENEIIPLYFDRDGHGYSREWIKKCKEAMVTVIPRFNSQRMAMEYVQKLYSPASVQGLRMGENNHSASRELAKWKEKINHEWTRVDISLHEKPREKIYRDDHFDLRVRVALGNLVPADVVVECLFGYGQRQDESTFKVKKYLSCVETRDDGTSIYALDEGVEYSGQQCYVIRVYPFHPLLSHPFETGFMKWL